MNKMQSSAKAPYLPATPGPQNITQNHEAIAINGILSHNASTDREPAEYHQLAAELRNAVATAQSAARAKAEIIASISQEVREPVDIVLKMLNLLNDSVEDPNQLQQIQTATQAGHAILSMINMVCEISPNNNGAINGRTGDEQRHSSQGGLSNAARRSMTGTAKPIPEIRPEDSRGPCKGMPVCVLLVEGLAASRQRLEAMLAHSEVVVDAVVDGYEAIDALNKRHYDLVLLNATLQGMDGLQTTSAIRQLPGPSARVPIIAMTQQAGSHGNNRFLDAGLNGCLPTPISADQLNTVIARWTATTVYRESLLKTAKERENPDMHTNNRDELDTPLSVEALEQLARDTDPEIVPDLIAVFVDDAKQRISRITDAIESRDYQTMAAEAHALGSSAATFGLPGIHTIAHQCEHMLREKRHDEGTRFAEELVAKAGLGLNALHKYAQSLQ